MNDCVDQPILPDCPLLGALELVADKATKRRFDASLRLSDRVQAKAYENRIIFRAFADNILGFAPALCYSESEMALLFERLGNTLDAVMDDIEVRKSVA